VGRFGVCDKPVQVLHELGSLRLNKAGLRGQFFNLLVEALEHRIGEPGMPKLLEPAAMAFRSPTAAKASSNPPSIRGLRMNDSTASTSWVAMSSVKSSAASFSNGPAAHVPMAGRLHRDLRTGHGTGVLNPSVRICF
jgi:hypothetical protein